MAKATAAVAIPPAGDLAHIAGKYEPVELQRRILLPTPNIMDMYMGKKVKPPAAFESEDNFAIR